MCHVSTDKCMDRERVSPQPSNPGKHTDSNWKSQRDSLHPTNPRKSSDNSSTGRGGHLCSLSPGKHPESNWKNPKETHPVSPVTSTERKWKDAKEPLYPVSAGKRMSARQSLEEKPHLVSLGKCTERDQKGRGKSLRPVSPARKLERDWRSQAETLHSRSPTRQPERGWRNQAETLHPRSPTGRPERDWRSQAETLHSRSPTRQPERDWRNQAETLRSRSPTRQPERGWRNQTETLRSRSPTRRPEKDWRNQAETLCPRSPTGRQERDWRSQEEALCSRSQTQRSEDNWKTQEKCLCHMNPMQQLERDWRSQGECLYSSQLDRGTTRPLNSASSMGSQDLYLNTNGRCHKPDLLNFKKGWMSILDELGETKDATFTLSAMTSGIRRNWIEALRKNVRPASAPDVTKLSDCNKENSIRSCVPQKGSLRSEEHWPGLGSEVISKGSNRKADGPRHTFDYVELAPLQQGPLNHGAPQRTRGSLRGISDRVTKHEDLERDLALRSEERRKWFEAPDTGLLQGDGPAGALCWKACEQELLGPALSEDQRSRLSEEIEKKWLELERLPLKESKRLPLTALLNQSKGGYGDTREALEKEVQSLRAQLESWRARGESLRDTGKSHGDGHMPQGFISQEACERSLAEMESLHQQVMTELQRHHQRELERLRQEKERLLAEEAAATAAAIEALKKVHKEELNRELGRTRSFQQSGSGSEALRRQHQLDVDSLKRELQVLSEQYSQKCLEIGDLTEKAEEREQMLQRCQQEGKELLRQNQELQTCLSEEIQRLRTFITSQGTGDGALHNGERSSCELEVLLRVKENELQYLKKEVQCLKDELQMMQKDKRFASGKYQDVYVELNHIKLRSEREIEQLKEHLRLAMAALQEKETLRNSISE
uniref:TRIO and F-actin binding protein n=1 Tax=Gopherus agassizii TaxID=38772 RepID=A0A452I995_9SAUR